MSLKFYSTAFEDGADIPVMFTDDSDNISPPLLWEISLEGLKCFAILFDDPEDSTAPTGVFSHWCIFNIPSDVSGLPENLPKTNNPFNDIIQGKNDFGKIGYSGPQPDGTGSHCYRFTLYALDQYLNLPSESTKETVLNAMKDHILGQQELRGYYPPRVGSRGSSV